MLTTAPPPLADTMALPGWERKTSSDDPTDLNQLKSLGLVDAQVRLGITGHTINRWFLDPALPPGGKINFADRPMVLRVIKGLQAKAAAIVATNGSTNAIVDTTGSTNAIVDTTTDDDAIDATEPRLVPELSVADNLMAVDTNGSITTNVIVATDANVSLVTDGSTATDNSTATDIEAGLELARQINDQAEAAERYPNSPDGTVEFTGLHPVLGPNYHCLKCKACWRGSFIAIGPPSCSCDDTVCPDTPDGTIEEEDATEPRLVPELCAADNLMAVDTTTNVAADIVALIASATATDRELIRRILTEAVDPQRELIGAVLDYNIAAILAGTPGLKITSLVATVAALEADIKDAIAEREDVRDKSEDALSAEDDNVDLHREAVATANAAWVTTESALSDLLDAGTDYAAIQRVHKANRAAKAALAAVEVQLATANAARDTMIATTTYNEKEATNTIDQLTADLEDAKTKLRRASAPKRPSTSRRLSKKARSRATPDTDYEGGELHTSSASYTGVPRPTIPRAKTAIDLAAKHFVDLTDSDADWGEELSDLYTLDKAKIMEHLNADPNIVEQLNYHTTDDANKPVTAGELAVRICADVSAYYALGKKVPWARCCTRIVRARFLVWFRTHDKPTAVELSDITAHSNYTDETWALHDASYTALIDTYLGQSNFGSWFRKRNDEAGKAVPFYRPEGDWPYAKGNSLRSAKQGGPLKWTVNGIEGLKPSATSRKRGRAGGEWYDAVTHSEQVAKELLAKEVLAKETDDDEPIRVPKRARADEPSPAICISDSDDSDEDE